MNNIKMNFINTKYITSLLFACYFIIILTNCTKNQEESQAEEDHTEEQIIHFTQAQYDIAGIETGKAEKRSIGTELKVNGVIDVPPHSQISITLPYGGFLKNTEMLPGTEVKKGQLLATIENPDFIQFQREYLENLAQQEYLRAEFKRQEKLFNQDVIAEKIYQQAKSNFVANEVRVRTMGDRLELIGFSLKQIKEGKTTPRVNIYSPITGSVLDVYVNVGKYISSKDVIMDITDTKDLHVELSVYENDIAHVRKGQLIRFTVTNSPAKIREAEVFLIGSGVREDRSVTVHGHLRNIEDDLLPGMYVSANLIIDTKEAWTLDEEAVVRYSGKYYVFILTISNKANEQKAYAFEMKEVVVGVSEASFMEVEYLLAKSNIETDLIVLKGAYSILSKSKNSGDEGHGH